MSAIVVFPGPVSQDRVDDAIAAAEAVLANILPRTSGQPRQLVTLSRDGASSVVFAKDERLDVTYAVVSGEGAEGLAERLASALGRVDVADLVRAPDRAWALRHAAVLQRPAETEPILLEGLASSEPRVRAVAALATAYASTPALSAALAAAIGPERDGEVAATMRAALATLTEAR